MQTLSFNTLSLVSLGLRKLGLSFVSDIDIANREGKSFPSHIKCFLCSAFSVSVLTTSYWPLEHSSLLTVSLPTSLSVAPHAYQQFYASRHTGRKLTWLSSQVKEKMCTVVCSSCFVVLMGSGRFFRAQENSVVFLRSANAISFSASCKCLYCCCATRLPCGPTKTFW